jgi:hypothetical protein
VACAVTLAGCGGGEDGTTESTTAGGTTMSGATGGGVAAGIRAFGKEGAGSELRQADESVAALFHAVESGDWSEVCDRYLSRQNVEAFEKVAETTPQIKGTSCPKALGKISSASEEPIAPRYGVGAIRIEGDDGFALYRGTDGNEYAISMKKEDGRWKLNALRPTSLEP